MEIRKSASAVDITLVDVLKQYSSTYPDATVAPLGQGNINDTFLVTASAGKFVLQRISGAVFTEPLCVITNFSKISQHLERKIPVIAPEWQFARPVYTDRGNLFYRDRSGNLWRGQTYLPHKRMTIIEGSDQGCELGRALGIFHLLMSDMGSEDLHDPLPGFHVLPAYLDQFDLAWKEKFCVGQEIQYCLGIIDQCRGKANNLERAIKEGILTEQPVHGDPKIDNFIFNEAGYGVGLIDLDTVGSGLIHFDLGDCLRSCCNRSGEDGQRVQDVRFDIGICRAILDGYFQRAATLLSPLQRRYIFDALLLITFELGLRFFTDYLQGNRYFKVKAAGDNLRRALVQFRLVGEIEKFEQEIRTSAEI
ncbi:MAG: aminoglycoside phosphotransferase family protein [Desulfobulbaceae bacterium]|nr:aminoglycoside phosphotransferase family protein [Desulfobulbaceae bacterium]